MKNGSLARTNEPAITKEPTTRTVIIQVMNFSAVCLRLSSDDQNLTRALSRDKEIKTPAKTEMLRIRSKVPYSSSENKRVRTGSRSRPVHFDKAAKKPYPTRSLDRLEYNFKVFS